MNNSIFSNFNSVLFGNNSSNNQSEPSNCDDGLFGNDSSNNKPEPSNCDDGLFGNDSSNNKPEPSNCDDGLFGNDSSNNKPEPSNYDDGLFGSNSSNNKPEPSNCDDGLFGSNSSNNKPEPYELIRRRIHQKIRNAKKLRQKKHAEKANQAEPAKSTKKSKKRGSSELISKAKTVRKCIENLIVKSPIQKEFSFPVSSRSSSDIYTTTIRINNGDLKLECNCGSKFRLTEPRYNCIHCIGSFINLLGNTISSMKNKKRYTALCNVYNELVNIMEEC